jgi:succinate dehydrogenase / fumarate reductase, flavoprotein subunit
MTIQLNANSPTGPISDRWSNYKSTSISVNPSNRNRKTIIVVGTGLAGSSASASLAEQGYNVQTFCIHDTPRRAHSIAAQGGINGAKNYKNDGDSIYKLFYETIKGGDYRARESNVHRLAENSVKIIDHCVALGVPFAREYGGLLDNRSFGGTQMMRTFYARGQTGQQLLLGAYQTMMRQVHLGKVTLHANHEMLDIVIIDGKARGIIARNLITGEIKPFIADAVVLASGGYGNVYYLSTNAKKSNATAIWRAHKKGALFANPCFTQIHPTCIPVSGDYQSKLTRPGHEIPEEERDYYLERRYPAFGNLVPRDVASRAAKLECDHGKGVGKSKLAVYLDLTESIRKQGATKIAEKYDNLFEMYEKITGDKPTETPMRIYPAVHYTMGGLWVDYDLMSTIPGLFVLGEANFSDHGANRLGASALMQGLSDGYFVIPITMNKYLGSNTIIAATTSNPEFKDAMASVVAETNNWANKKGNQSADYYHRKLGLLVWEYCGMERSQQGLTTALDSIAALKQEFMENVNLVHNNTSMVHMELEKVQRVSDFFDLGQLMCLDALTRQESCGGHFRSEHQTPDNEALRDDVNFAHVAAWEYNPNVQKSTRHVEKLQFEYCHPTQRNYK